MTAGGTVYFFIADSSTGAGKRSGNCMASDLGHQAQPGETCAAADGLYPTNKFKLDLTQSPPAIVPIAA